MATTLYEMNDRLVTTTGEVVAKLALLEKFAKTGKPLNSLKALPHSEVARYNSVYPQEKITVWTDDGNLDMPPESSYDWNLPVEYKAIDIPDYVVSKLVEKRLDNNPVYIERVENELAEMERRGMLDFLRCLIFIMDEFRRNNVVWGVGRGSACASLVLYLLGTHRVDPVRYNIPITEFLK